MISFLLNYTLKLNRFTIKMTTERCDSYVHDVVDMSEPPESTEKSEIISFFDQANILVTGGTGFLGKLLVEKLLRYLIFAMMYFNSITRFTIVIELKINKKNSRCY